MHKVSEEIKKYVAIKSKNTSLKSRLEKFSIQWDTDSDFIQKFYRVSALFCQNIKLSLCTDVLHRQENCK